MKNILFLCTGNSCRSQMAEGFGKALKSHKFNFFSAGTKTHGLNPRAIKVMSELGVDISSHESKTTDQIKDNVMDFVITVCADAQENCPYFPNIYFWRTHQQQEIDYLEAYGGQLHAFEFAWNVKNKKRLPTAFASAYPDTAFSVVTPENLHAFVMPPE